MILRPGIINHPLSALGRLAIFLNQEMGRIVIFFFKGLFLIFSLPVQLSKILSKKSPDQLIEMLKKKIEEQKKR